MQLVFKAILGKLIDFLVKKAEQKFTEAKSGSDKKAYVIKKIDELFDVNDDEANSLKQELIDFVDEKIENSVANLKK